MPIRNRHSSRRLKRRNGSESGGNDRYLITYADLLTLLLGLFVVLYASSITDLVAYNEYKEAFYEIFDANGGKPVDGGEGILDNKGESLIDPLLVDDREPAGIKNINELGVEIKNTLREYFSKDKLDLRNDEEGLVITMNERMLFGKGSSDLKGNDSMVLDSLAKILAPISNPIEISGHTDSDPISTTKHPTNWHLAADRAANTALYMFSRGVNPANVKIVSRGSERPLVGNTNEDNKTINRRVEITIKDGSISTPISTTDTGTEFENR